MVGDAAHGLLLLAVACGEGKLQLARDQDRVFIEELVEVTDAAEHQAVGMRLLGGEVLPHGRRKQSLVLERCGGHDRRHAAAQRPSITHTCMLKAGYTFEDW